MTKWDTIQLDVADAYVHLEEEEQYQKDIFGFADAIEIDHLSDAQIDMLLEIFGEDN